MFWREFGKYRNQWPNVRDDLNRLQSEVQRILGGWRRPFAPEFPAMNVWTDPEGALLTAELPGMAVADLEISVRGSTLTLAGKRESGVADATYHRRERETGEFARSFDFPFKIDAAKVKASARNGVLEIELPRAEEDKPRKISVKAG